MLPSEFNAAGVYQRVLIKRTTVALEAAKLDAPEWKHLAYEMAVKVCEADGVISPAEKEFLGSLAGEFGIAKTEAVEIVAAGDEVAGAGIDEVALAMLPSLPPALPAAVDKKSEVDSVILKTSILNGALELLPETLSTMAIIPLLMKLVNSVGKHHGVFLREHMGHRPTRPTLLRQRQELVGDRCEGHAPKPAPRGEAAAPETAAADPAAGLDPGSRQGAGHAQRASLR